MKNITLTQSILSFSFSAVRIAPTGHLKWMSSYIFNGLDFVIVFVLNLVPILLNCLISVELPQLNSQFLEMFLQYCCPVLITMESTIHKNTVKHKGVNIK